MHSSNHSDDERSMTGSYDTMGASMYQSVNGSSFLGSREIIEDDSLVDPPIPPTSTYQPPGSPSQRNLNVQWDYDNYIEPPRGIEINQNSYIAPHHAKPHYVTPSPDPSDSITIESPRVSSAFGLSPALLAILAYFFGFPGGLVVMLLERRNLFVLFHAWQSLTAGALSFVGQLLVLWSSRLYTIMWIAQLIFTFWMCVRVIFDSPTQRLYKLPGIGDWCEYRAHNKIHYHTAQTSSSYNRMV
eukprot:TRINITY_DN12664_c0_g1_i1.p1 TRINITY_DN12664_c0_g1~~TRINITY_DN12664_c0_g1_i1.p1  ORF type:complete len:243 (+),score=7.87 TRINITY_DN12664_c0_g1_i1:64-792(+)